MTLKKHPYHGIEGMSVPATRLISEPIKHMRNVVILGSGASRAAFPVSEETGPRVPLFQELVDFVGLTDIIPTPELEMARADFESWYSDRWDAEPESPILRLAEQQIVDYFASLQLPNHPTLYDHLLLCLREVDLVATFNWDPFLFDAWERNRYNIPLPEIVHLHGNVRIGVCYECKAYGRNGRKCPSCGQKLYPSRILYPVKLKNYQSDPFIRSEWERLDKYIEDTFTLTIFGYGAPKTDVEAVRLMQSAWKKAGASEIRTITVIDRKQRDEGIQPWRRFILPQHFSYHQDFYSSSIAKMPRRSCELIYVPTFLGMFVEDDPLPRNMGFEELYSWLATRINAEK